MYCCYFFVATVANPAVGIATGGVASVATNGVTDTAIPPIAALHGEPTTTTADGTVTADANAAGNFATVDAVCGEVNVC